MSLQNKTVLTPFIKSLLLTPPNFPPSDLTTILKLVVQGLASDVQLAAFLTALKMSRLDHNPLYVAAMASALLEFSSLIPISDSENVWFTDIVGTGGDGQNTFNVSTSAAIVAAGMGLDVCKHGGKASSSASGAGDLMTFLGVDQSNVTAETFPRLRQASKFSFLLAPNFHPAMAKVAPVRAQLNIPTIFNLMGPLINPAPIASRIIGVYAEDLGQLFAEAFIVLDKSRYGKVGKTMVVWGCCGLDEISPIGRTKTWTVDPETETVTVGYLEPSDFGLAEHTLDTVQSGTPSANAETLISILQNQPEYSEPDHPLVDYIVMNAAALAVVSGLASDWKHGVILARKSISSGAALEQLRSFADASRA
ncbi:Anthranilate phosphoribosyltransferase [Komagataella phaffii CBS 7435]|uniref:Anthranilate phosphoribosyltransferase n=2 Tax=Komagataella phaffii TaxID=460519 RepID=C4R7F6_KOMPG|nr:Anthranilate phosphoribosyl transferase of the tryptophan biosynthetic pathway [Komagataella phaffii GS115]AOA64388.1 GQ67_04625T0 [Komagataella phaffii]CAH2451095.1 Anthranilate phosphoribosyltransferase [Komagataella phaffii CBS 7435]AOA70185.1 GQ68_04597T0 [Komagataella phaffii GS115]CAY71531.1 Anthranilate phosphoribosyl transferase of the tryptophan biosynthetic pathway [Komagataella phaffii GS115]CCA40862.1 Anthranilate phosphoribosyltransferase [Komagataella phaffii CBS 7435]